MNRWSYVLVGLALVQGSLTFSPLPEPEEEWRQFNDMLRDPAYRLPTTTRPRHYEVSLTPYFEVAPSVNIPPFTFDGSVVIYTNATEAVNEIVIHCNDLTIQTVDVTYMNGTTVVNVTAPNQEFQCEAPYSFLRIATSQPLVVNQEYIIRSTFRGNIQTTMRGFYRSWYNDTSGRRWMGTTQFQPSHAREAFPCYDEPGFKATFDITIVREEGFKDTISNMPIRIKSEAINGRVSETFHTTPLTSTYLLAFIVSHYDVISSNNDTQRPFEIYARDNVGNQGDWSLDIGELLLDAMEEYTQIPYYTMATNMNMKQAAIPDFSAGAMENWGLLTYREALILYDPLNTNHFYKQRVANIVSHEIAHMWFGNLVTCAWWDNLWLNEGFARFYQYYLTASVAPELGFETRFIVEQLQGAMLADSIDSAHPLTDPTVNNPTTVSAHFSTITYARGAAVLRMTQYLLGNETYVKGLRSYLKDRQYDVAEPHHLFEALDAAAAEDQALSAYNGITIDEYFKTWSEKAGHPLLTVSVNQQTGRMTVTQERWERTSGVSQYPSLWQIPITWTRAGAVDFDNLKPSTVISAQVNTIERGTTGLEWVIFNKQVSGFYRVNYDDTNWALITRALRSATDRNSIHEYNRAQIVDDLFAFARANVMSYQRAFNILSFLEFEDAYAPWISAITGYNFALRRLAHDADSVLKLQELIIQHSAAVASRLGYAELTGESYMNGLQRMYVMQFLCDAGHQQCVTAGIQNFQNWKNGASIPANMRPWVYCTGLRNGDATDFDYFWNRYLVEDLASEKVVMIQAAGCTTNTTSLEKFLDAIVAGDDTIRPQDFSTALSSAITSNEVNTLRAFEWLKNNLEQTRATTGLATPLNTIVSRLLNESQISEVRTWLDATRTVLGDSVYNTGINAIATARSNIDWYGQRVPEFARFFEIGYVEDLIEDITDTEIEEETGEIDGEDDGGDTEPVGEDNGSDSANIAALSIVTLFVTLFVNFIA